MRQSRLIAVVAGPMLSACLFSTGLARTWSASENASLFGDLDQYSLTYSFGSGLAAQACGPASITNSLIYLENAFPATYGSSLITLAKHDMDNDGGYTAYDDLIETAGGVMATSTYMNTTAANGTWHDNFIMGGYKYIESKASGKTTYSAVDEWSPNYWGNSPTTYPPPSWVQSGYPTWNYLYNGLNSGNDEQILLSYVSGGGHFVTLTSLTWNDQTNSGTLGFVNSLTGSGTSTNIRLNSGVLYTDFNGSNGSYIGEAMNISPTGVPEPSTLALLGVGAIGLVGWAWRRRR